MAMFPTYKNIPVAFLRDFIKNISNHGVLMKSLRIVLAFVCVLSFTGFVCVPPAQANIWEFFFPSLRALEPDPSQTLQAPFAEQDAQQQGPSDTQAKQDPNMYVPLKLPHLTDAAVSEWVVTSVSDALTFSSEDYTADLARIKPYFDDTGYAEFTAFLQEKRIVEVLTSKQFFMRSFVQSIPLLLNEGAVAEHYRWLYEVPVMMTYMDRGMKDYKGSQPVTQRMIITLQIGRTSQPTKDAAGLRIERWSGKTQFIDKK
jgi:hypothetical protein